MPNEGPFDNTSTLDNLVEKKPPQDKQQWHLGGSSFHDPLLECLLILTRLEHQPFSGSTLTSGLPLVENKLTPSLFIRAAKRAGLSAQMAKRAIEDIPNLVLPCVLLLKNAQACILLKKNNQTVSIIEPLVGEGFNEITLQEIKDYYTDHVIFIRPTYRFDERSENMPQEKSWFWSVINKTWKIYAEVMLASFFINLFAIASSLFVMNVYDRVVPNNALNTLWVLASGVFVVYSFDFLMKMLRGYFIDIAAKKSDVILSSKIFSQMMNIRMESRPESVGSFANNMQQFESFREFFTSTTISTLIDLPFVLFFIFIIYSLGATVAWVPLLSVPLVMLVGILVQKPLNKSVKESYRYTGQKHAMLIETLTNVETIKGLGAQSPLQKRWEHAVGMSAKIGARVRALSLTMVSFAAFVQQLAGTLVVIVGVYRISDGLMTTGALIACTILTGRALAPLSQVASLLTRYHQSMASLQSIDKLMKLPTERLVNRTPLYKEQLSGALQFNNVSFKYPRQTIRALDQINFSVKSKEKIAIIGKNGSGKTTLEKLLLGLYQALEGSVLLDGIEISQLDPSALRRNVGYVAQDIALFYGSVKDNIIFGAPFTDDETIMRVANISGVSEFVAQHPQGFNMPVGERGEKLSGGQRQAIAIARALILNPSILILDEPTNMMDNRAEELFSQQLERYAQDKTLLLITHKMNLLKLVDRIIILEAGRIIADGPRDVILKALTRK